MDESKEIEYLYHYTSVEKLALILKNRTIRFNPLHKMDDPEEQQTADIKNLGKYVFVSSWTSSTKEDIPMWNMYTNLVDGVRIGLRKTPFVGFSSSDAIEWRQLAISRHKYLFKMQELGVFSPEITGANNILKKVDYCEKVDMSTRKVLSDEARWQNNVFLSLGITKNSYWDFQQEWRYILHFYNWHYSQNIDESIDLFYRDLDKLAKGVDIPNIEYFDLDIAEPEFTQMIITPSPKMSMGNKVILETLIERYNPTARVIESELLGRL